jgi:hypothetical protein
MKLYLENLKGGDHFGDRGVGAGGGCIKKDPKEIGYDCVDQTYVPQDRV